jgi:hypothetical protein
MKVTVPSIIADDKMMVVFYELESSFPLQNVKLDNIKLTDETGKDLMYSLSYDSLSNRNNQLKSLEFTFTESLIPHNKVNLSFSFKGYERFEGKEWVLPIEVDDSYLRQKQIFEVNQTVINEGQLITIKTVTIYPTRVGVHVAFAPDNTKKIFGFDDLRLVDERGESWTIINNGIVSQGLNENEQEIYLQSNYFENPKELYLTFSSLRALDKNELTAVVDPLKPELLKVPKDGRLKSVRKEGPAISSLLFALLRIKVKKCFLISLC